MADAGEGGIGEAARRSGVRPQTVRWYEQRGLLPPPPRTAGGQRRYGPREAARLAFIRHARDLGFPLRDVRALLDLADHPERPCAGADAIARAHLADVEARIARLEALRGELRALADSCASGGRAGACRVIEALADAPLTSGAASPLGGSSPRPVGG